MMACKYISIVSYFVFDYRVICPNLSIWYQIFENSRLNAETQTKSYPPTNTINLQSLLQRDYEYSKLII